jgi:hypothetical protein
MSPVLKFGGENDLPGLVIDQSEPSGLAARIELEPERLNGWLLSPLLEHKSERIPFEHGSFARCEQEACSPWMHRIEWLSVGIDYKHK